MRDPSTAVAAVVVNWNAASLTLDVLAQLDRVVGPPLHVVVVDNGSHDDSVERLRRERPGLDLVETGANLGFAGANNIGIRHAVAGGDFDWLLLINNDVEVDPGFLAPLMAACVDPSVAAAGPKILYQEPPDLIWAAGGRLRVRETVTCEYGNRQPDGPRWSRPAEVDYLTTCCLLVPRDSLERVGLFDPVYFVGVEDADWCRRARDAGLKLRYVPESTIWHMVAVSTGGSYTPIRTYHTGRSNALFARRHFGPLRMLGFLAANCVALPAALLRELPRRNARAALAKARGVWEGLRHPLREPPPSL